jgi:hypothetical protein
MVKAAKAAVSTIASNYVRTQDVNRYQKGEMKG